MEAPKRLQLVIGSGSSVLLELVDSVVVKQRQRQVGQLWAKVSIINSETSHTLQCQHFQLAAPAGCRSGPRSVGGRPTHPGASQEHSRGVDIPDYAWHGEGLQSNTLQPSFHQGLTEPDS